MNRAERRRLAKEKRKSTLSQSLSFEELLNNAMQYLHAGQVHRADKLFNKLISAYPNEPTSLHFAGITKYQLGLYSEALILL